MAGTSSAHAAEAYACRSWNTGGAYAQVTPNISIDSCYDVQNGNVMSAHIYYKDNQGYSVTYCAHAIKLGSPGWAHDFGCASSSAPYNFSGDVWAGTDPGYGQNWYDFTAGPGTYVVSAGLWLNGHYYGDVQSPQTYIG